MSGTPTIGGLISSLMPAAPGGVGVGGTPEATGLFGVLMADVGFGDNAELSQTLTPGNALLSTLPQLPQLMNSLRSLADDMLATLNLGDAPIAVQGEATLVQVMTQTVTVMYQQLTVQGGFEFKAKGPTGDLAAALTTLGLPADEAQALAAKIDTMLQMLDVQLNASKEKLETGTAEGLIAVLLAAMASPQQLQQMNVMSAETTTITQVQALVSVQVNVSVTSTQQAAQQVQVTAQNQAAATDVLSTLTGVQRPMPIMVNLKPKAVPQVDVAVQTSPLPAEQADEALSIPVAQPVLQMVLPEGQAAIATQAASVAAPTVQPIPTPKPIVGEAMYKLLDTPAGTTVLQVLAPKVPVATEQTAPTPNKPLPGPVAENLTQTSEPPTDAAMGTLTVTTPELKTTVQQDTRTEGFAQRFAEAQRYQAAQQVSIAIQPMLKGDGGSVRMTLNPPELGRIEVHLKIEAGQISGAIAASEPAVVEHLARELPALRQSFAEAGLKLGDQGLSLMLNNNAAHDQQRQPNPFANPDQQPQPRGFGGADANGADTVTAALGQTVGPNRWVNPDRLIDVAI